MRPPKSRPDPTPHAPEAFYDHYIPLLVDLGTSECGLSRADAQKLAHEVLVVALGSVGRIDNMRAWLTATMRSAARLHQETDAAR
ncbi:MAG TPA: hypothetical protein VEO54_31515 [Thermoanaerobaculia bacterium]|nr:hypothetical protein [Thermoanaerobaculia bacterium]